MLGGVKKWGEKSSMIKRLKKFDLSETKKNIQRKLIQCAFPSLMHTCEAAIDGCGCSCAPANIFHMFCEASVLLARDVILQKFEAFFWGITIINEAAPQFPLFQIQMKSEKKEKERKRKGKRGGKKEDKRIRPISATLTAIRIPMRRVAASPATMKVESHGIFPRPTIHQPADPAEGSAEYNC